jgi:hypothetical protein
MTGTETSAGAMPEMSRWRAAARSVVSGRVAFLALIAAFVIAFTAQINMPPLERYPGWDHFWVDAMSVGKLCALKDAVSHGELPAVSPYVNFDENLAGDPSSPVSVLSPVNLLVFVLPIPTAIVLRTMVLLALGGGFAFVLLHRVTEDKAVSLLAALTYISLPYTTGLHYHYAMAVTFFVLPLILYLVLALALSPTRKRLVVFGLISVGAVATGDVHTVFTLTIVVFVSTAVIAWHVGQLGRFRSLRRAAALTAVFVISSLFYLVPLAVNLRAVAGQMHALDTAGWHSATGPTARQVALFVYRYGAQSIFKPIEGSGLLLYAPAFVLLAVVIGATFHRALFVTREQRAVFFALVTLGLAMFVACVGVYALPGGMMRNARGVLRLPINAFPFMMTLAAFCCLAAARRSAQLKGPLFALLIFLAVALDLHLFGFQGPGSWQPMDATTTLFAVWHGAFAPVPDSNAIDVRFMHDMWEVLPWANLALLLLALVAPRVSAGNWQRHVAWAGWTAAALLMALFYGSLHSTLRVQQQPWQWATRSAYRYDAYLARKACTDALVDRRDPDFRTLYVGSGRLAADSGRDWQLVAETELHQADRAKVLFSYRETMHPYAGVMRGLFSGAPITSNAMPPLSREVAPNIWSLRLMGVRWVISVEEQIDSPDLAYVGQCSTPEGPISEPSAGTWYIYHVQNPSGVAFLVDQARTLSQVESLRALLAEKEKPLQTGTVFLEEPVALPGGGRVAASARATAGVVEEGFGHVTVRVNTSKPRYLVLSYVQRPGWSVQVDGQGGRIHRAYGGLMCVPVAAGLHTVRFDYHPFDVRLGMLLSLVGLVGATAAIRWV